MTRPKSSGGRSDHEAIETKVQGHWWLGLIDRKSAQLEEYTDTQIEGYAYICIASERGGEP
jgi:hypothetical protein